jgi:tetraacyldisaccharide 4'-kinase
MGSNPLPLDTIDEVLLVTGIAHPEPLVQYVSRHCKVTPLRFGDHHRFSVSDIKRIRKAYEQLKGERKLILTTEKDAARLRELSSSEVMVGLPIYYLPIEMRISPSSGQPFNHTIESIVHENVSFLERMKNTKFNL